MKFEKVVLWGRNLYEYSKIFALSEEDLTKKIIDCAAGPSSFNCEVTERGGKVISCDPIYSSSKYEIYKRIQEAYKEIIAQIYQNMDEFTWKVFKTPEDICNFRLSATEVFLNDFKRGKEENRYITTKLPCIEFDDNEFEIALCSYLLFYYSNCLTLEFHMEAIKEMLRLADEARIFPVINMDCKHSIYLEPVMNKFKADNYSVELKEIHFDHQKSANELLVIKKIC